MGERSVRGWWSYFPLAFLFKSTPAELLMTAALPFLIFARRRAIDSTVWLLLLSMAVFGAACLLSRLDIGLRYALVVYPVLADVAVDLAWASDDRRRLIFSCAALLVALQAASAIAATPRYLSYFNAVFTRPGEGYTRLADSNVDWGQDLPALKLEMDRLGVDRVVLAYLGTAPTEAYGVHGVPWDSAEDPFTSGCRFIAISATYLDGVYLNGDPFSQFRALEPAARAADSIFLYDSSKPVVLAAFRFARQQIRQR
jgi:hypothetical protein